MTSKTENSGESGRSVPRSGEEFRENWLARLEKVLTRICRTYNAKMSHNRTEVEEHYKLTDICRRLKNNFEFTFGTPEYPISDHDNKISCNYSDKSPKIISHLVQSSPITPEGRRCWAEALARNEIRKRRKTRSEFLFDLETEIKKTKAACKDILGYNSLDRDYRKTAWREETILSNKVRQLESDRAELMRREKYYQTTNTNLNSR